MGITQLLPTGHKLGEPSPLFTKLEPAYVEELKQKFAGQINGTSNTNEIVDIPKSNNADCIANLEKEVAKQGLVVRKLKEGGANKSEWQPEVTKLLQLKNKLGSLMGTLVDQKTKKKK